MNYQTIITIGREFGSGGRGIGEAIAKKLDIPFYDRKIISLAADKSGLQHTIAKENDEQAKSGLFSGLINSSYFFSDQPYTSAQLTITDELFLAESAIIVKRRIKDLALLLGDVPIMCCVITVMCYMFLFMPT